MRFDHLLKPFFLPQNGHKSIYATQNVWKNGFFFPKAKTPKTKIEFLNQNARFQMNNKHWLLANDKMSQCSCRQTENSLNIVTKHT